MYKQEHYQWTTSKWKSSYRNKITVSKGGRTWKLKGDDVGLMSFDGFTAWKGFPNASRRTPNRILNGVLSSIRMSYLLNSMGTSIMF